MLVALRIIEPIKRSFGQRFQSRKQRQKKISSAFVQVDGGRYMLITAEKDKKGQLDWQEIRRIAGGEASRMLLPHGILPPNGYGIRSFQGQALARELMIITALYLLRTASVSPRCLHVAIYDPMARMPALAAALLPYSGDVRVVTNCPHRVYVTGKSGDGQVRCHPANHGRCAGS